MHDSYDSRTVEREAQEYWEGRRSFRAEESPSKPKFYCLSMFPYPSGKLHMGHVRNYTIGDVLTRYYRMRGRNVLQPMGWDAFGLPAENAAMANKVPPAKWTYDNIAYMKRQLKSLGFALDWERELATCRPDYYKWNQWLFTRLFKKGLAYKKTGVVNWDPVDQTVLANEQVIEGRGWRTGAPVEKREIPMYFFRITAYAEELLSALDELPGWPEQVKLMQKNWLGKSEGVRIGFEYKLNNEKRVLWAFTTRADTLMGATFVAVAAEHPIAAFAAQKNSKIREFVEQCKRGAVMEAELAQIEKKGMPTGVSVSHPLTNEKLPVWVGNYVLMGYGEGAVMGVPAHDERDYEFALKYGLPIKPVIRHPLGDSVPPPWKPEYAEHGACINSGPYDGLSYEDATNKIAKDLKAKNLGEKQIQWRLRDWGVSRQRYWGTPIPIVHCERCGAVPVPYEQLPVVLPRDVEFTGRGGSPLSHVASFVNATCPQCGGPARRDTDTMDTFVDSSWYMYRYVDPNHDNAFMNKELGIKWLPVQQYTGGVEHAILHLLYMRFMAKALRDLGELWFDEPALRFRYQGTIVFKGRKMSKSRGNVETPDVYVEKYGADTLRLFMMFMGPWVDGADWDASGIEGVHRFLRRVWEMAQSEAQSAGPRRPDIDRVVHRTIAKVTEDLQTYSFNTAVAAMMELSNALQRATGPSRDEGVATLRLLLAPFAPYMTEEVWERRGGRGSIHRQTWPAFDPATAAPGEVTIVIQIDGKVRDRITAPAGISQSAAEKLALASSKVKAALDGREPGRTIFVPDRLVNFVTRRPS